MAAEMKEERIAKIEERRAIQRVWGIKDTKVTETKYWDEGKVELWHAQDGSLCDIYELTKIKSSPKRQNATCLPTSSPDAGFDRHRVVVLQATGRRRRLKRGPAY
jgi:hypothetical protein